MASNLSAAHIRYLKQGMQTRADKLHEMGYRDHWPGARRIVGKVLHSHACEFVITSSILLSMALVVIETDAKASDGSLASGWEVVGLALMVVYVLEISCRIYVLRMEFFQEIHNCVDFVIVVVDLFLEMMSRFAFLSGLPSIRFLRIFRLARLLRAIRVLTHFRELYLMVHGLFSAFKAVSWAAILIGLVVLMWSILAVEVLHPLNQKLSDAGHYERCDRCPEAYSSVWNAFLTLITQIVAGDAWGLVTLDLIEAYPLTSLFFLASLSTINLGIMNLVLMVIVDRAQEAREDDVAHQMKAKEAVVKEAKKYMFNMCQSIDEDHDGTLTLEEIHAAYDRDPEFSQLLHFVGVAREDLKTLYEVLEDDHSGPLHYEVFVDQLNKMKTQDTHMMLVFVKYYVLDVRQKLSEEINMIRGSLFDESREDRLIERVVTSVFSNAFNGGSCLLGSGSSHDMSNLRRAVTQELRSKDLPEFGTEELAKPAILKEEIPGWGDSKESELMPAPSYAVVNQAQAGVLASVEAASRELEKLQDQLEDEELTLRAQRMLQLMESFTSTVDQKAELFQNLGGALQQLSATQVSQATSAVSEHQALRPSKRLRGDASILSGTLLCCGDLGHQARTSTERLPHGIMQL